jgi:hypothetical protein
MSASRLSQIVGISGLLALSACASQPREINNVCAVFDQRDGWVTNWRSDAAKAERRYGVPVPILMATLRKESGFKSNARPARAKLFGVIPWKRPSSAYGYSQALDGTWDQYRRESGNFTARRTNFGDAVDFVGWYHARSAATNGVALNDAFGLYLNYYFGWAGYARGEWRSNAAMQRYARETAAMAERYAAQLRQCG